MNSETLYKWDVIPAAYDYAACDFDRAVCYTSKPEYDSEIKVWCLPDENTRYKSLPLSVLNRLPGEPSETLEKRPGVRND